MTEQVEPFRIEIADDDLRDLRERLARTRWPEPATVDDWSQGTPLDYLRELCCSWAEEYDWRPTEARLNALPQFRREIDGLGFHFLHVRSPHADALPLVITHGWPGSIVEFLKVIGPLTDPSAHGGDGHDHRRHRLLDLPERAPAALASLGGAALPRHPLLERARARRTFRRARAAGDARGRGARVLPSRPMTLVDV